MELLETIAGPVATVLAASVPVALTLLLTRKPVKVAAPTVDVGEGEEPFRGTNAEMMGMMWRDWKTVTKTAADAEAKAALAQQVAAEAKETADAALADAREIREQYGNLVGAIQRYLRKIANAWHSRFDTPFPPPDDEDFEILKHALPREHIKENNS
jgi:hypothetical protein